MPRNTGFNDSSRNGLLAAQVSLSRPSYKCSRCKRKKPVGQFSNKQQNDLRKTIQSHRGNDEGSQSVGWMSCKACTAGQNTEMTCIMCQEVKGLDDFAKTHRRNRDHAKCKICMNKIIKTEPDEPLREEDEDSSDSNPYDEDFDDTTSSLNGLTINDTDNQSTMGTTSAVQDEDGSVWVPQSRFGAASSSGRPNWDPSAYGGSGRRGGSASGSGVGSNRGSQSAQFRTSKSGWAKPPRSGGVLKEPIPDDIPPSSSSEDEDDAWNKKGADEDSDTSI